MRVVPRIAAAALVVAVLSACHSPKLLPMPTVLAVDLPRFMGDWYVIANIPTRIERGAHNAVESYRLLPDGTIDTHFAFRQGSFDGPQKRYNPRGFVLDKTSNALWGMQFIWPVKADYRIIHLNASYTQTVVGRLQRDYVWIMSRTPQISPEDYVRLLQLVAVNGYDVSQVKAVPQQWSPP
jgi:apolipoprotein D and lipocalin family protein